MKWLMPYDLYERHAVVSRLLQGTIGKSPGCRVLDVGGRAELLERFLPYPVFSINIDGTADLVGSGFALPFSSDAFSAVVSIDTLEHLPRAKRESFLRECFRVSRDCVVVAAPFGSAGHTAYEEKLEAVHEAIVGEPHLYLSEHICYGLPDFADLAQFADALPGASIQRFFAGDYLWQGKQFEQGIRSRKRSDWQRRLLNFYHRITSSALFHPVKLQETPSARTNRFYLLIEK